MSRAAAALLVAAVAVAACTTPPPAKPAATSPPPGPSRPGAAVTSPQPKPPPASPKTMYVSAESVEERTTPTANGRATNRLYRGQAVTVYEVSGDWARVSEYYDGRVEQQAGQVARWVPAASLASTRPAAPAGLNIPEDPRIPYLTRVPGDGLNERDVLVLHAAARYYLETGRARRIEDGDKSLNRPGWYYLNFGGEVRNYFFRPSDIPDLEARIQRLQTPGDRAP